MLLDLHYLYKKYNLNITGVIHIGAHRGTEYDIYRKIPDIKNIVFFEPDPDNYKILQEKTNNDSLVTCINRGLGPFTCKMMLNRENANQGQSNSVLNPKLHKQQYPGIVFTNTIEIRIDPLDKYTPSAQLNMINIDVQGFELEVFRGAKQTLKNNIQYIMTEVNRAELYENCALIEDVDNFLHQFNFKRVETDWAGNTWGDAFYVKY